MPIVIVEMWEGRTIDQKRTIVDGITTTFEQIGVPPKTLQIVINDVPKHNWAIAGKLASEM